MRIAIISDIHGNFEALTEVLNSIKTKNIDDIICLGDIVGYGANPNECVNLTNRNCSTIILGNHDAAAIKKLSTHNFNVYAKIALDWTASHLTEQSITFLENLPDVKRDDSRTYVHATPYQPSMWYYITSLEEAAFNFNFFDTQLCFIGHTHIPMIIGLNKDKEVYLYNKTNFELNKNENERYIINVGSVGQPRDRCSSSCYGIIDTNKGTFNYERVEYDIKKTQAKMEKIKMPKFLITRLLEGK